MVKFNYLYINMKLLLKYFIFNIKNYNQIQYSFKAVRNEVF